MPLSDARRRARGAVRRSGVLGAVALLAAPVLAAVVGITNPAAMVPAHAAAPLEISGWSPYFAKNAVTSTTANASAMSEVTPFIFTAKSATSIGLNSNISASSGASMMTAYQAAAAQSGKPLIGTVVDAMGARGMAAVLADPVQRTAHVQALMQFVANYGLAGIDLDYESFAFNDGRVTWPDAADGTPGTFTNWGSFLVELATALHAAGKTLEVSVPPVYDAGQTNSSGYWVYNYPVMHDVVDRVKVMMYAFSVGAPGPIAPYNWVSTTMDFIKTVIDPGKLVLGIPAYGTDWVTDIAGSCPVKDLANKVTSKRSVTTATAFQAAADAGRIPTWNAASHEYTFDYVESYAGPDANGITVRCNISRTVWFVDARGISDRTLLAQNKGLVGVALWALGYEDQPTWNGLAAAQAGQPFSAPGPLAPAVKAPAVLAPYPEPILTSGPLPARYLDTRSGYKTTDGLFAGKGRRPADSVLEVQIAGRGPVPGAATAVTLNVTVLGQGTGFVTVYPCGTRPTTSNLNVTAGQTISNSVLTRLSANGTVCIYTQQAADLVVDVFNVLPDSTFTALPSPARLLDTRPGQPTIDGQSSGSGLVPAAGTVQVTVAGRGGISDAAGSAVLNVTAVDAVGAGFLTVWPCDGPRPATSNVNYVKGRAIPNAVVTALGADGTVCVYSSNATQVVIDVSGELDPATFLPLAQPARLMETRSGYTTTDNTNNAMGARALSQVTEVQISGRGGLPATTDAVVLNVTVDGPQLPGFVTVYACGTARPPVSNVNFAAGQTLPNLVVTKLSATGTVCVFNSAPTDVIIDVFGTLTI